MPVSLIYMFVRMLLGALLPGGRDDAAKELEIVVLRHQIGVLRRQVPALAFGPPRWLSRNRADRIDVPGGCVAQDDLRSFGSCRNRTIYGGRGGIAERRTPGVWTPRPMASGARIS